MSRNLDKYIPIVGASAIAELRALAAHLEGVRVQHVNSTRIGGGVAEILARMVPLLEELGLDVRWDVIGGNPRFFDVTKKLHNALHGRGDDLDDGDIEVYEETAREEAKKLQPNGDIVFVHDPQPMWLARDKSEQRRFLWRCHVDVSHPRPRAWQLLADLAPLYDAAVFSAPQFARELSIPQFQITPSIDPLSLKNKELPDETIAHILDKHGIVRDRPIVTQISRFDRLKDPVGVLTAFRMVRKTMRCQLVLAGGGASDDPEGAAVLAEVRERAGDDPDVHVLLLPPNADVEINALQRASDVVVQKSLAEGFGLTVSEALWKGRPVVASAVGGIPLQVEHGTTGLLVHTVEGTAHAIRELLNNAAFARWLGDNGREHVRRRFLLTRHIADYLLLFLSAGETRTVVDLDRPRPLPVIAAPPRA